ncbi:MAG: alpha/beta fold hydrolase [Alphaproteobacteria bacterium]|nr:alpha/beta fold hydrolase [Alphaproteobacteria bacterium]
MSPEAQARLQKLASLQPSPNPAFEQALAQEAAARGRRFLNGIKAYRQHPARRKIPAAHIIWQDGTTKLRDYNPKAPDAPAILVIPSLINRFDILDLDRDHSFLRALAEQGFRPFVVDWDEPGESEKNFTLEDYITQRLIPAFEIASEQSGKAVHILGYCMGGLLALALAALRPQRTRTLTLMATPWDFHKPDAAISPEFLALADELEPSLQANGILSVDIIQSLFSLFQPMQVFTKFVDAAALDPASAEARHFVLLEDWLNDGVPLTAPTARECLRGWYGENLTARFAWTIGGQIIDPRTLNIPSYVLAPGKDRIVPPESAMPLAKLIPRASLHEPMMGHIGLIASRNAPQQVWAPLFKWLDKHK